MISRLLQYYCGMYVCRRYGGVHIVAISLPSESRYSSIVRASHAPEIRMLRVRFPSEFQKHFSEFAIEL